jgi:hypothetical protein
LIYGGDAERRAAVADYLAAGLDLGERCIYILSETPLIQVVDDLNGGGVDVALHASRGSLRIMRAQQTFLRSGAFVPEQVIELLRTASRTAVANGYVGVRVAGEMEWALGAAAFESLVGFEERVNEVISEAGRVTGLCLYDARRFEPDHIRALAKAHPVILGSASGVDQLRATG